MALISKPDYTYIWSSGGSKISPTNTKIQIGWTAEVPPFQYENWIQNRQDQAIAHIFQRGIAQWDGLTNYEANVCYVTGTDGLVYKSVAASGPATTSQDPVTDSTNTYWTVAFAVPGAFLTESDGDNRYLQKSNNLQDLPNIVTARTNLSVYSKAESADLFSQTGIVSSFSNLKLSSTGSSGLVSVTADELVVKNSSNNKTRIVRNINLSASIAVSGLGGIDTGVVSSNTWYAIWVVYNDTTSTAGVILSLESTNPTLPSGFAFKARVGWIRTDSTANKFPLRFYQKGKKVRYSVAAGTNVTTPREIAAGTTGGQSTYVSVDLSTFVPSTAVAVTVSVRASSVASTATLAPSAGYTSSNAPLVASSSGGGVLVAPNGEIVLESGPTIFYSSDQAGTSAQIYGWEDSI